ncbi:pilus assembly PilX N-terminal domain-containing protein [Aurantivibrio plasticivorans]
MNTNSFQHQRGATLIVALILLLVMSLVAISSMTTSILEEKMSINMQNSVAVFQAAESGIDQTLQDIPLLISVTNTSGNKTKSATLSSSSEASASIDVAFVREKIPDEGGSPDATQAGGSWSGGGIGNNATAIRYFEAESTAALNTNADINTTLTQGFYYCVPGCQ